MSICFLCAVLFVAPGDYEVVSAETVSLIGNRYRLTATSLKMSLADGRRGFSGRVTGGEVVGADGRRWRLDLVPVIPGVVMMRVDECEWLVWVRRD